MHGLKQIKRSTDAHKVARTILWQHLGDDCGAIFALGSGLAHRKATGLLLSQASVTFVPGKAASEENPDADGPDRR